MGWVLSHISLPLFPKPMDSTTDTTQCNTVATRGFLTKKSSTLPLTFHFFDCPSFLSIFFVYQNFPLFSVSFLAFSVSPLFNLYLGVGWVSRWRSGLILGFWGWVMVEIRLWVTAWLESICCGSALGWCFGGVDRHWVSVLVVWISAGFVVGAGLVGWCFGGVDRRWVGGLVFRCFGSALSLLSTLGW